MSTEENNELEEIYYFDREKKRKCREEVLGDGFIKWAYLSLTGRLVWPLLFRSALLSKLLGKYFDSCWSKGRIAGVIKQLSIDTSEFLLNDGEVDVVGQYRTFNDFFYRKLRPGSRPCSVNPLEVCLPADGRVLVYPEADEGTLYPVKGAEYGLESLLGKVFPEYKSCSVAVIRLCPADYHRFHFPCAGKVVECGKVSGQFHSVNPVALRKKPDLFCVNKREYTVVDTDHFGRLVYLEVAAFGVAGIEQTFVGSSVEKMQEKGFFKFGGSTVVLVFESGKVIFSEDLVEQSRQGVETLVKVGQPLGVAVGE
jgi:phosphatidylserine decarboxylase